MQEPLSLLELNQVIKNTLSSNLEPSYWVIAEIAQVNVNQRGHCYLELVQKNEEQILSKSRGTIWAYEYRNISYRFESVTGKPLNKGMKVLVNVVVSFHEIYGLSLNIRDVDPNFTLGERARKKQEIIDRLINENLYDLNKHLLLPSVPQNIAVISSSTAAGYGDFIHQLESNPYGYSFKITLYNSVLQGDQASFSISENLRRASNKALEHDLIVLIRGGGSQIDLDCFDSYEICKAIAECEIPVITGIGHERDETIADMVAHTRLKTPSAVGEFLVDGVMNFEASLLNELHRIKYVFNKVMHEQEKKLDYFKFRIHHTVSDLLKNEQFQLNSIQQNLKSSLKNIINSETHKLSNLEEKIRQLDPASVFERGYTLSSIGGKSIHNLSSIEKGQKMKTYSKNFIVESVVSKTSKKS